MATFPLPLADLLGHWGSYAIYAIVGIAFGMSLEGAGFGNSKLLAAQFYFKDMRVFKVMFTAIIVAMTLIFPILRTWNTRLQPDLGSTHIPVARYRWRPGHGRRFYHRRLLSGYITGGPGNRQARCNRVFVFGVLFGIYLFGETISSYAVFFESSYMGRFTLPELFNANYGTVVFIVVVAALSLFVVSQKVEAAVNKRPVEKFPTWSKPAAGALVAMAAVVLVIGQPTNADRWEKIALENQAKLDNRQVQIAPAELLKSMNDSKIKVIALDVRDERYYNQFHLRSAVHVPLDSVQGKSQGIPV